MVWQRTYAGGVVMAVDGRPFLNLRTQSGASCKVLRPELRPLALGISSERGGIAQDNATHTIGIPLPVTSPPADLVDNAVCWVDVERGVWTAFRVLRNGIDKGAGVWTLYVRQDDAPAVPSPVQPAPSSSGYWDDV